MNKKLIKKQCHISMEKFIRYYLDIEGERIIDILLGLNHRDFKDICRELGIIDLTSISFEDVTKEDIETGSVLLVADINNNLAPYINPILSDFDLIMEEERRKNYDFSLYLETYEEYIDTLDEIVSDVGTSDCQIKRLSYRRSLCRKDEDDD